MKPSTLLLIGLALLLTAAPAIAVKAGVVLPDVLKPTTERIRRVVAAVFSRHGYAATITSGLEGDHRAGSKHDTGDALDFRTRDLPGGSTGLEAQLLAAEIAGELGAAYDVVLEASHLHVEYDPA